jgi:hypothetical protein
MNNQDLTLVIEFIVTVPRDLWDNVELSFNENEYSFYDADLISEIDGIVTASIVLESIAISSTPERAAKYFDEYSETMPEPSIKFNDYIAPVTDTNLYKVREYGI